MQEELEKRIASAIAEKDRRDHELQDLQKKADAEVRQGAQEFRSRVVPAIKLAATQARAGLGARATIAVEGFEQDAANETVAIHLIEANRSEQHFLYFKFQPPNRVALFHNNKRVSFGGVQTFSLYDTLGPVVNEVLFDFIQVQLGLKF